MLFSSLLETIPKYACGISAVAAAVRTSVGGGGGGRGSKGSGSTEGMEGGKTIAGHGDADADDDGGGDTTAPTVTVKHTAKINWLAAANTTALFVADTSAVISEYTMPP